MNKSKLNQVKAIFNSITKIPNEEWDYASGYINFKNYRKNEHLLEAGTVAEHSFVILKGIIRVYYLTDSGREFNKGFAVENQIAGSISSIIKKLPSRFFIQALEDIETALLPRLMVEELYENHRMPS